MGPFAWDKMVLIFLVVLVLFGPKELPKVARTIAKFMNDFKRAAPSCRRPGSANCRRWSTKRGTSARN